jgi:hypothetical protein
MDSQRRRIPWSRREIFDFRHPLFDQSSGKLRERADRRLHPYLTDRQHRENPKGNRISQGAADAEIHESNAEGRGTQMILLPIVIAKPVPKRLQILRGREGALRRFWSGRRALLPIQPESFIHPGHT